MKMIKHHWRHAVKCGYLNRNTAARFTELATGFSANW
jgi:hypothetical protein